MEGRLASTMRNRNRRPGIVIETRQKPRTEHSSHTHTLYIQTTTFGHVPSGEGTHYAFRMRTDGARFYSTLIFCITQTTAERGGRETNGRAWRNHMPGIVPRRTSPLPALILFHQYVKAPGLPSVSGRTTIGILKTTKIDPRSL